MEVTGDKVLVKVLKPDAITEGGIVIPEQVRDRPVEGVVVGLGPTLSGEYFGLTGLALGDTVLFAKYGGVEVDISYEQHYILQQRDILAVLERVPHDSRSL